MDQNTLNLFLLIFLVVIASCAVIATVYFVLALRSFTHLADEWSQIAENLKEKIKLKVLAAIPSFLLALVQKLRKRG